MSENDFTLKFRGKGVKVTCIKPRGHYNSSWIWGLNTTVLHLLHGGIEQWFKYGGPGGSPCGITYYEWNKKLRGFARVCKKLCDKDWDGLEENENLVDEFYEFINKYFFHLWC